MSSRLVALVLIGLFGCHHASGPTLTGAAIYARVGVLQADRHAPVTTDKGFALELNTNQWLVTAEHDQMFQVGQVVENCKGGDPGADVDCTLALLMSKQFHVHDQMPTVREPHDSDLSFRTKALLVLTAVGAGMTYGAFKCDVFDGCKGLMGIGAGLDGLIILVILLNPKD